MKLLRGVVAGALAASLVVAIGCERSARQAGSSTGSTGGLRQSDRGDVLFTAVVGQLRNLSNQIDTELTPPAVILDAKASADGQDVLAIATTHPDFPDGPINHLSTSTFNSRFRNLGVRPGDIVKYYAGYDEESMESGIYQAVAVDLPVAQVLSDNALLIDGSLRMPVLEPTKIEIWRYVDDRIYEIARKLQTYVKYAQPAFDWEPTPDARVLKQIVERLNQWMRQSPPKVEWSADPLLATLPPSLANDAKLKPLISESALIDLLFQPDEGRLLQEAIWHRDVSRWAQGGSIRPVDRAAALFDWTIRNVQLDADAGALPMRPWEVLLFGHGTAAERAWVFAELCRQQGLEVVALTLPQSADGAADGGKRFWLPALLSDGQLHLFDTRLGLPIPGPGGEGVATLAQVQADPQLLSQLDLDDAKYGVTPDELQHVTASPIADAFQLTRRAKIVESKLTGDDRLVLTAQPSATAERLKGVGGVETVAIWDFPFATLRNQLTIPEDQRRRWARDFEPFAWRPTLYKARVLHFRGHRNEAPANDPTAEVVTDHNEAVQIYTSRLVRPPDRALNSVGSDQKQRIYSAAKDGASYWVGLLLFDDGKFPTAENWFHDPRLSATGGNPWTAGTRYNLARTYEAQGKTAEAAALYEADDSPQRHGSRVRAKRLKSPAAPAPTTEATSSATEAAAPDAAEAE
jgi:hypothetical protein